MRACLLLFSDCRQVQCWCSLVSMTNASARPPRFPSVLYDLGRLACTFQMSCRCSGLWAAWLHTCLPLVLQIRLIPDLPACLQLGSQLFPICKCSLDALGCTCLPLVYQRLPVCCGCSELHGSTLAPHLSPTGPACVCKSIVGVLGRTVLHLCLACLPLVSDCLPVCGGALHFSRTVSTDTLDVLCRMNLHLSPTVSK